MGYYTGEYYPNVTCNYTIIAPEGYGIEISVMGDLRARGCDNNLTFHAGNLHFIEPLKITLFTGGMQGWEPPCCWKMNGTV